MLTPRTTWAQIIREAHRRKTVRLAQHLVNGGAIIRFGRLSPTWEDLRVVNWYDKVRRY